MSPTNPNLCLQIENLSVVFPLAKGPLWAVRDLNLTVEKGETLGIVGESGCGKSMTAMAIMNLLPPNAKRSVSTLRFNNLDLTSIGENQMSDIRGNDMAMIFQEPMSSLNPAFTIGNQLTEVLKRHRKIPQKKALEKAVSLLEKVGITGAEMRLRQYPHELSGGIRQRVMIAMSLMCEPKLIIADEPTTALDVTIQAQILQLLSRLQREFQLSMILITHDLGVVANTTHRVAVMYGGQVIEIGKVQDLFENPMHPYTQGLMACIPVPGKNVRGSHLGAIPGRVSSLFGNLTGCSFANRCAFRIDECFQKRPPWRQDNESQRGYRCRFTPTETRCATQQTEAPCTM